MLAQALASFFFCTVRLHKASHLGQVTTSELTWPYYDDEGLKQCTYNYFHLEYEQDDNEGLWDNQVQAFGVNLGRMDLSVQPYFPASEAEPSLKMSIQMLPSNETVSSTNTATGAHCNWEMEVDRTCEVTETCKEWAQSSCNATQGVSAWCETNKICKFKSDPPEPVPGKCASCDLVPCGYCQAKCPKRYCSYQFEGFDEKGSWERNGCEDPMEDIPEKCRNSLPTPLLPTLLAYGNEAWLRDATGLDQKGWALSYERKDDATTSGVLHFNSSVSNCSTDPISDSGGFTTIVLTYFTGNLNIEIIQEGKQTQNKSCPSFDLGTGGIKKNGVVNGHLIEGARGDYHWTEKSIFKGKLNQVSIIAETPADYHDVFWLMLAGSAALCILRLVGHVMLAVQELEKKAVEIDAAGRIDPLKGGDRYISPREEIQVDRKKNADKEQDDDRDKVLESWGKAKKYAEDENKVEQETSHKICGLSCLSVPRSVAMIIRYFLQQTVILWAVMWLVCPRGVLSPSQEDKSFMEIFWGTLNFSGAPWGWLFAGNAVLETCLLLGPVLVLWPAWPERGTADKDCGLGGQPNDPRRKHQTVKKAQPGEAPVAAEGEAGLNEQGEILHDERACLLIACHQSVVNDAERKGFKDTLEAALDTFDGGSIFVCDNARGNEPMDTTEDLVAEVNEEKGTDIHYVYIPCGNKTFALWWTIEEWIPKLVEAGTVVDNFKYLVMIDNDVPLPTRKNKDNKQEYDEYFDFKAMTEPMKNGVVDGIETVGVCYTIKAVPKPGDNSRWGDWLVSMQDAEYKMSGFTKLFQSYMGSAFYAHGAVSLWNIKVLKERILLHHDTEFNGEDMYMGLLMHRENSPNRLPWVSKKSHALSKITVGEKKCWPVWMQTCFPGLANKERKEVAKRFDKYRENSKNKHFEKARGLLQNKPLAKDLKQEGQKATLNEYISSYYNYGSHKYDALEQEATETEQEATVLQKEAIRQFENAYNDPEPRSCCSKDEDPKTKCRLATSGVTPIKTYAPDTLLALFMQRVKSWDVAAHRKFSSIVTFFLFYWRGQHLILKPYMLAEIITVIQDFIRTYIFIIGFYVDARAFGITLLFWFSLAYVQLIMFKFKTKLDICSLKSAQDKDVLEMQWFVILTFPLYKFVTTMLFRQFAMMQDSLVYSHKIKAKTIEHRLHTQAAQFQDQFNVVDGNLKDIPPSEHLIPTDKKKLKAGTEGNERFWWRAWNKGKKKNE
jgi:hypothetical protein